MLNDIYKYIADDPLKALSIIGVGLIWYDRYKNRSRLNIKILNIALTNNDGNKKPHMRIEVENIGASHNSICESIKLSGTIAIASKMSKGQRIVCNLKIITADRNLPLHKPVIFEAYSDTDELTPHLWFMKIEISTTRGRKKRLYVRSAFKKRLSWVQYIYERYIKYGIFNDLIIDEAT